MDYGMEGGKSSAVLDGKFWSMDSGSGIVSMVSSW